jgi:hypothetical protein
LVAKYFLVFNFALTKVLASRRPHCQIFILLLKICWNSDRTKIQFTTSDRHYELNSVQAAIAFISWFIDVEFCIALPNLQISDRTWALGITIH